MELSTEAGNTIGDVGFGGKGNYRTVVSPISDMSTCLKEIWAQMSYGSKTGGSGSEKRHEGGDISVSLPLQVVKGVLGRDMPSGRMGRGRRVAQEGAPTA